MTMIHWDISDRPQNAPAMTTDSGCHPINDQARICAALCRFP